MISYTGKEGGFLMIRSIRDLIPRRRERLEKDCQTCFIFVEPDRLAPGGEWGKGPWIKGRTIESRTAPGRWIQWLGHKWFWRSYK